MTNIVQLDGRSHAEQVAAQDAMYGLDVVWVGRCWYEVADVQRRLAEIHLRAAMIDRVYRAAGNNRILLTNGARISFWVANNNGRGGHTGYHKTFVFDGVPPLPVLVAMNPDAHIYVTGQVEPLPVAAPAKPTLPPAGAKVKLKRDGPRWWDVRCADDRFAILTRQAAFKPKGEVCYTILDLQEGVRGPCNLIGQSWDKYMPDEACQELLADLQIGAKGAAWNAGDRSFDMDAHIAWMNEHQRFGVEISHRNRLSLDIGQIRTPKEKRDA